MVDKAKEKSKMFEDKAEEKKAESSNNGALHKVLDQEDNNILAEDQTFTKLGVCQEVCDAVAKMGYKHPSKIQAESLPYTLKGRDIIGLAETGSGKTAAFAIPVIQSLLNDPQPFYCLVMSPTRELCVQISEQFEAIGSLIGLRCAVLVGGLDMVS